MNTKQTIGVLQFAGFAAVSLLGTLLHFLYDLTGSRAAALFSGVNESTWEHMKLLFFPLFGFAIVEGLLVKKTIAGFWCIKLKGALLGLIMIPVLFYTLRGIFGNTPDWINIAIFFISAAIAFWWETEQMKQEALIPCRWEKWAFFVFLLITAAFWIFTFLPPAIPLFRDPVDGSLGIPLHAAK